MQDGKDEQNIGLKKVNGLFAQFTLEYSLFAGLMSARASKDLKNENLKATLSQ